MAEPASPLMAFSDHVAVLVERASASIVAVHGGRWSSSGIHWRHGVIVTAKEVLERDDELTVTLPGGRKVAASLAGRDPSTDVAALRTEAQSLPIASTADAGPLRPGHAARAGLVIGDIVTAWNAQAFSRVRDVMRRLGPDSVGNTIDLQLLRGGAPKGLKIVIGERPLA
jgi:S1-C subfamily serine protease